MTDTYMTIREMCDAYDVTPRTLRFYESKELLAPLRKGTRRLFTRSDRARLTLILRGKRFGFSLEDIRQLLDLYDPQQGNAEQVNKTYTLGQQKLEELTQQRTELDRVISDLTNELNSCRRTMDARTTTQAA